MPDTAVKRHHAVESSNVKAVGYDADTNTLEIIFLSSPTIYRYHDVDPITFAHLMNAPSIGKFYTENVRSRFKGEKVTP